MDFPNCMDWLNHRYNFGVNSMNTTEKKDWKISCLKAIPQMKNLKSFGIIRQADYL